MIPVNKTIRGLDCELYKQAKASAVRAGKTLPQWLNEAIALKLKKENKRGTK